MCISHSPRAGRRARVAAVVVPVVVAVVVVAAPGSRPLHDATVGNPPAPTARPNRRPTSCVGRRCRSGSLSHFDRLRHGEYRQPHGCRSTGHREFLHRRNRSSVAVLTRGIPRVVRRRSQHRLYRRRGPHSRLPTSVALGRVLPRSIGGKHRARQPREVQRWSRTTTLGHARGAATDTVVPLWSHFDGNNRVVRCRTDRVVPTAINHRSVVVLDLSGHRTASGASANDPRNALGYGCARCASPGIGLPTHRLVNFLDLVAPDVHRHLNKTHGRRTPARFAPALDFLHARSTKTVGPVLLCEGTTDITGARSSMDRATGFYPVG